MKQAPPPQKIEKVEVKKVQIKAQAQAPAPERREEVKKQIEAYSRPKPVVQEEEEEVFSSKSFGQDSDDSKGAENFGQMYVQEIKTHQQTKNVSIAPSNPKFLNKDLESKTNQMQEEFELLMQELNKKRQDREGEAFYQAIDNFYGETGNETHTSPTKRLIKHKNTTFEHKKTMKSDINKGDYSLVYTTADKSYVVEPHGGQLNYNLAQKNPLKFYDQVFNQEVTKHTIGKDKDFKK